MQLAGPFAPRSVAHLGVGIGLALQAIHTAGIVHRDLKPANVLVASDGPRVIDFGIARAVDASMLTATGMRLGTPSFMAPEQVSGSDVDAPADVWAVGGMLIYAATGRTPFGDGNAMAILYRVENHDPDLSGLEPALAYIARAVPGEGPGRPPHPDAAGGDVPRRTERRLAGAPGAARLGRHRAGCRRRCRGTWRRARWSWRTSARWCRRRPRRPACCRGRRDVDRHRPEHRRAAARPAASADSCAARAGRGRGRGRRSSGQPSDQYSQGTAMSGGQGQYGQPGGQTGGGQYGVAGMSSTGGQYGSAGA